MPRRSVFMSSSSAKRPSPVGTPISRPLMMRRRGSALVEVGPRRGEVVSRPKLRDHLLSLVGGPGDTRAVVFERLEQLALLCRELPRRLAAAGPAPGPAHEEAAPR